MSTRSHKHQGKKTDRYVMLVVSVAIIISVAIWVWYDVKLSRIEQEINNENPKYIIRK